MQLQQYVTENCPISAHIRDGKSQDMSIFLVLPDSAKDVEKAEATTKVTDTLVQLGWIIANVSEINHATSIEYTKKCDAIELINAMLFC